MSYLLRQSTLDRSNRKKDGSVSITFITDLEQDSDSFMEIDKLTNHRGVLCFKDMGEITDKELKEIDNMQLEVTGKSLSEELRNAIWAWSERTGEDMKDFYPKIMRKYIEHVKSKGR